MNTDTNNFKIGSAYQTRDKKSTVLLLGRLTGQFTWHGKDSDGNNRTYLPNGHWQEGGESPLDIVKQ